MPPDRTDQFVDTLVEKLVEKLQEKLPLESLRYQKENVANKARPKSTSSLTTTSKTTQKPTQNSTAKLKTTSTIKSTSTAETTTKSVRTKTCAQDEMVRKVIFQKTHKTASSTVQNMLFRFGEKRNLNFALPKNNGYRSEL